MLCCLVRISLYTHTSLKLEMRISFDDEDLTLFQLGNLTVINHDTCVIGISRMVKDIGAENGGDRCRA